LTKRKEHWHPPDYTDVEIRAVQAIERFARTGEDGPSARDCQKFLDWLLNVACGTYDEPFRPGNADAVNYMLGRRSVGLAVVKLLKLKPEKFKNE
jgi:hypothetical protein